MRTPQRRVPTAVSDSLEAPTPTLTGLRGTWRSAQRDSGEESVTTSGTTRMPLSCASNWATQDLVSLYSSDKMSTYPLNISLISGALPRGSGYYDYRDVVPIVMDDVQCVGNESSIFDCPRSKRLHNCNRQETARVTCRQCESACICTRPRTSIDATNLVLCNFSFIGA